MSMRRIQRFSAMAWLVLIPIGCNLASSGTSPASALGQLSPFDGPPRQSEPKILDDEPVEQRPASKRKDLSLQSPRNAEKNVVGSHDFGRNRRLSLPVTESRTAVTDDESRLYGSKG